MSVTRAEVLQVAELARLHLSPTEVERLTEELNGILAHVAELERADVSNVSAVGGATEWPAPLRADEPGADPLTGAPTALSDHAEQNFFTVPRLAALDAGQSGSSA